MKETTIPIRKQDSFSSKNKKYSNVRAITIWHMAQLKLQLMYTINTHLTQVLLDWEGGVGKEYV